MNPTNDIRHKISCTSKDGNAMTISIRLNDKCKNGHQDFAITGDIYEKGKPKIDRYFISGGCIHDEILKVRPDLKMFVDLHLCDYLGVPMHPVDNGFYRLQVGFDRTPPNDPKFPAEFCEYYRITDEQYNVLSKAVSKVHYAILLKQLGILDQWKAEADAAIAKLEEMSGQKFLVDSKRSQLVMPSVEEIDDEMQRIERGYYSDEAIKARQALKFAEEIEKLEAERQRDIAKVNADYDAQKAVRLYGLPTNNFIFYNHCGEGCFNWKSYEKKVTQEELDAFLDSEICKTMCPNTKFYLHK